MPSDQADQKPFILANIEDVAKIATAALGLLYVLGFLVSNIQLMALGIADFSALQARNIMIGFLFFGYFIICAAVLYPIAAIPNTYLRALSVEPDQNKLKVCAKVVVKQAIAFLVVLWAVALVIGQFLPWGLPYWDLWRVWLPAGHPTVSQFATGLVHQLADAFFHTTILFCAIGIICLEFVLIDAFSVKKKYVWRDEDPAIWLMAGVLSITFFGFLLYAYANDVYPNFKYNLGGGQPQIANLALTGKKSEIAGLENAGLVVQRICCRDAHPPADGGQPAPRASDADEAALLYAIAIWYQSEKFLYIAAARDQTKSRVVAIDLKLVRSIHYIPNFVRVMSGGRIMSVHSYN